jgi:hypothetical protein
MALTRPTTSDADEAAGPSGAALPVHCLRCGGAVEGEGLGLRVFRHSKEVGSVCHDCAWDGNGHAILNEDELEGWLHSVG